MTIDLQRSNFYQNVVSVGMIGLNLNASVLLVVFKYLKLMDLKVIKF